MPVIKICNRWRGCRRSVTIYGGNDVKSWGPGWGRGGGGGGGGLECRLRLSFIDKLTKVSN